MVLFTQKSEIGDVFQGVERKIVFKTGLQLDLTRYIWYQLVLLELLTPCKLNKYCNNATKDRIVP